MKGGRSDWNPSSGPAPKTLSGIHYFTEWNPSENPVFWAIKIFSSFFSTLIQLVFYCSMQSGTTSGTENKCSMWEPSRDVRAQIPLVSTGKGTLIFLILCFAIDLYQHWYPQGTKAVAHLFLCLILDVWCPKHTVRKPATLSAGCTTGKGL